MSTLVNYADHTNGTPRPYSASASFAGLVFPCGQVPTRTDGSIPDGIDEQVVAAIDNLERVLVAAGSGLDALLQVTVYLADLDEFDAYNKAYVRRLDRYTLPPRTTVQVAAFRGTKRLEMSAIAAVTNPSGTHPEERP